MDSTLVRVVPVNEVLIYATCLLMGTPVRLHSWQKDCEEPFVRISWPPDRELPDPENWESNWHDAGPTRYVHVNDLEKVEDK